MRRSALWASFAAVLLLLPALLSGQWARDDLSCVRETGERIETGYVSRSYATAVCNALNRFEAWLGTAEAVTVRYTLKLNADGSFDTDYPNGDKNTGATVQPPALGNPIAQSDSAILIALAPGGNCSGGTLPYTYYIRKGTDPAGLAALANSATLFDDPGYTATGLDASTTYYFDAYCVDSAGMPNTSVNSNVVSATTQASPPGDTTAPTVPGNCAAVSGSKTTSTLGLDCDDSTDAVGVTQYTCSVGTATTGPDAPLAFLYSYVSQTSDCLFTNLAQSQRHYLRMSAQDLATNSSNASTHVYDTTATSTPTPPGNIIFRETFEGMPLGLRQAVAGRWATSGDCNMSQEDCYSIANTSPVVSGFGKYFRTRNVKNGTTSYRTEYTHIGTPYATAFSSLGGGHYLGAEYWYGYILCLDTNNTSNGYGHYADQWHYDGANSPSPAWSLMSGPKGGNSANGFTTFFYIEGSQEPGGTQKIDLNTNIIGQCVDVIWQVKADTRTAANGSTGILRLWFSPHSSPTSTPKYEWVNKQVAVPPSAGGDTFMLFFKFGGYQSSWKDGWGVNGEEWLARYDNYTVMDSTGSFAAMTAALATAN